MSTTSGVVVTRTNNTRIRVAIPRMGNRWQVDHILWMARELEKAVEAGMPKTTEIKGFHGDGSQLVADHVIVQEIP